MNDWKTQGYISYVAEVEKRLREAVSRSASAKYPVFAFFAADSQWASEEDRAVHLPPHFYGELASTSEGCKVLAESKHLKDFVDELKDTGVPSVNRRGLCSSSILLCFTASCPAVYSVH